MWGGGGKSLSKSFTTNKIKRWEITIGFQLFRFNIQLIRTLPPPSHLRSVLFAAREVLIIIEGFGPPAEFVPQHLTKRPRRSTVKLNFQL